MGDPALLFLLISCFVCVYAAQDTGLQDDYNIRGRERPRRGGSGFVGMRGRRSMLTPVEDKRAAFTGMRGKKAPFNGMRGKKSMDDLEEALHDLRNIEEVVESKRSAFTGMRGKKASFNGMRGKKSMDDDLYEEEPQESARQVSSQLSNWLANYLDIQYQKRRSGTYSGFVGMRG